MSDPRRSVKTEESLRLKDTLRIGAACHSIPQGVLFLATERRVASSEKCPRVDPTLNPRESDPAAVHQYPLRAGADVLVARRKLAQVLFAGSVKRDTVERIVHHPNSDLGAEAGLEGEFVEMQEGCGEFRSTRDERRLSEREPCCGELRRYRPHDPSR
jgi:hypothetical protein